MQPVWNGWSQSRSLGALLQSPAHRVLRVLQVTTAHWPVAARKVAPSNAVRARDLRIVDSRRAEHA